MNIHDIEIKLDPALVRRMSLIERLEATPEGAQRLAAAREELQQEILAEQEAAYGPWRLRCQSPTGTSTAEPMFEAYNSLGQVVMSFPTKGTARAYADAYDLSIRPIKES